MLHGLIAALGPGDLLGLCIGTIVGIVVGALPGLTATMGVALLLPFTFTLPLGEGLAMLSALFVSAMFADAIPAVLVNIPGTPAAMTTAFDGYPLAKQGKAQFAIVAACMSSAFGALFGGLVFLLLASPVATVALRFGPPEFFWVGVFALTIIGGIAGNSLLRGIAGAGFGMLISTVGISQTGGVARYTFGFQGMLAGISLVAGLVGVFAIPQVMEMVADRRQNAFVGKYERQRGVVPGVFLEVIRKPVHLLRSAVIGTFIGILPGAGSPVAALVSYSEAIRWSRDKSKFGKGALEGVTASEVANTSCAPASMIPLVGLGVPGSAPAAIIGGALLMRGLQPGPNLFRSGGSLVYEYGWLLILAGFAVYIFGSLTNRIVAHMISVPVRLLAPIIVFLTVIGCYAIRNNMLDVYTMLAIGIFAYFLSKLGFHPGPIGLGLILGPIIEPALVQSIALTRTESTFQLFLTGPVNIILIALTIFSLVYTLWSRRREGRRRLAESLRAPEQGTPAETALQAEEGRREREPRRDLLSGLVLLALAAVSFSQLGSSTQDWAFPTVLTDLLLAIGAFFVLMAGVHRALARFQGGARAADRGTGRAMPVIAQRPASAVPVEDQTGAGLAGSEVVLAGAAPATGPSAPAPAAGHGSDGIPDETPAARAGDQAVSGGAARGLRPAADIAIFLGVVIASVVAMPYLTFWPTSFLMLGIISIFLTERRSRGAIGISVVTAIIVCVISYLLFVRLFYVPLPLPNL